MKKVNVEGTMIEVGQVITELYKSESNEILITGPGSEEVGSTVIDNLKSFKVAFEESVTEEGQYIKIFD